LNIKAQYVIKSDFDIYAKMMEKIIMN